MSNEALIAEVAKLSSTLNDFGEYRTGTADYLEGLVDRLADALEAAERKPVIDREALARQMFIADNWGVADSARLWDELLAHPVEFERYRKRADAVIASGLIEDKREAQAEALEAAADAALRLFANRPGAFSHWLRARAATIREAQQ